MEGSVQCPCLCHPGHTLVYSVSGIRLPSQDELTRDSSFQFTLLKCMVGTGPPSRTWAHRHPLLADRVGLLAAAGVDAALMAWVGGGREDWGPGRAELKPGCSEMREARPGQVNAKHLPKVKSKVMIM